MYLIQGSNDFTRQLTDAGKKLVVVDFFATWCGPCKSLEPVMHGLETLYPHAVFLKVDVDQCQELAASCGIRAMPTIQLYKSAKKVSEIVGADVMALKKVIDTHYVSFTVFSGAGNTLSGEPSSTGGGRGVGVQQSAVSLPDGLGSEGPVEIQIRLTSGDTIKGSFQPSHTLADVCLWASSVGGVAPNSELLLPGFPRKVFGANESGLTLQEADLVPRAQLVVLK